MKGKHIMNIADWVCTQFLNNEPTIEAIIMAKILVKAFSEVAAANPARFGEQKRGLG
jgi:hypothetical protein